MILGQQFPNRDHHFPDGLRRRVGHCTVLEWSRELRTDHDPQPDLVAYARAVAEFYGREIRISSGRRNNEEQAAVMFKYWTENLKRGQIYVFLRSNPGTAEELDELYAKAAEGQAASSDEAAAAKKKFLTICSALAPKLSAHVAGRAIDVSPKSCMSDAMRDAMKLALKEVEEKTCFHYEARGSSVPAASDSLKKQWDAP